MRDSIQAGKLLSRLKPNRLDDSLHRRNPLRLAVAVDAAAVDQYFQLVQRVLHLRLDAVLRFEFALQAPGQASQAGSNQTATNFYLHPLLPL